MLVEEVKEKIIKSLNERKLTKDELRKAIGIKGEQDSKTFEEVLVTLEIDGLIFFNDKGFYHVFDKDVNYIQGQIFVASDGMGRFVGQKDGKKIKYRILHDNLNGALDGDIVVISDLNRVKYDRKLGKVEKIIKRSNHAQIFEYIGEGIFKLYNDKTEVYMRKCKKECDRLVVGTLVLAKLNEEPIVDDIYDGTITKVCGHIDDPKAMERAISLKYGFDHEFSKKVIEAVDKLPVSVSDKEMVGRVDLRDETIFTIDGNDTKDIDDAISIRKKGNHYILKVHIADVSHYTYSRDDKTLFEESIKRGNSAYFADSVVPMLPHEISNGICSLNPGVDRLTKTGEFEIDEQGNVVDSKFYKSVIRSRKKMNYDDVNKVLSGTEVDGYQEYTDDLMLMNELSKILISKQKENGALTFYNCEFKIKEDLEGKVQTIMPENHGDAEKLIEMFMITANVEFTDHFGYSYNPFIFRVHENPDYDRLKVTLEELKEQKIDDDFDKLLLDLEEQLARSKGNINPADIENLLLQIKDKNYFEPISNLILKSMKRAYYSDENLGHFGLASDGYTHFTSPIRRACDQINHVICDLVMEYNETNDDFRREQILDELEKLECRLPNICMHISKTERLADKVEEEITLMKKLEYFEENIEDYEGPIAAKILYMSKSGIIAQVDSFEVIIPAENIRRYFKYRKDSRAYTYKQEKLCLGDEVYLLSPEVFKEKQIIIYDMISKDPEKLLSKPHPKKLVKSLNVN